MGQLLFNNRLLLNLDVKSIVFKEKIGGFQFKQSQIMKVFILTLFATAFLSAYASPGGYILKGGVDHRYKHGKPAGYYDAASQAGRFAQQKKLEEEIQSEGFGFGQLNSKRSVPAQQVTFFTTHANHAALTALAQENSQDQQFHTKRNTEAYHKPLYYNEHPQHNRK